MRARRWVARSQTEWEDLTAASRNRLQILDRELQENDRERYREVGSSFRDIDDLQAELFAMQQRHSVTMAEVTTARSQNENKFPEIDPSSYFELSKERVACDNIARTNRELEEELNALRQRLAKQRQQFGEVKHLRERVLQTHPGNAISEQNATYWKSLDLLNKHDSTTKDCHIIQHSVEIDSKDRRRRQDFKQHMNCLKKIVEPNQQFDQYLHKTRMTNDQQFRELLRNDVQQLHATFAANLVRLVSTSVVPIYIYYPNFP